MLHFSFFPGRIAKPPFVVALLCVVVIAYWAVRFVSPLPLALPSAPSTESMPSASVPIQPAALWQNESSVSPASIRLKAIVGSPAGHGRVVLDVDGNSIAGNAGDEPVPGLRILSVRPEAVDIEFQGRPITLRQPLPVAGL